MNYLVAKDIFGQTCASLFSGLFNNGKQATDQPQPTNQPSPNSKPSGCEVDHQWLSGRSFQSMIFLFCSPDRGLMEVLILVRVWEKSGRQRHGWETSVDYFYVSWDIWVYGLRFHKLTKQPTNRLVCNAILNSIYALHMLTLLLVFCVKNELNDCDLMCSSILFNYGAGPVKWY